MGYLGWTPEVAWNTPVPVILHAIEYRVDWAQKTNPFGGKKSKSRNKGNPKPTPDQVKAFFGQIGVKRESDGQ